MARLQVWFASGVMLLGAGITQINGVLVGLTMAALIVLFVVLKVLHQALVWVLLGILSLMKSLAADLPDCGNPTCTLHGDDDAK